MSFQEKSFAMCKELLKLEKKMAKSLPKKISNVTTVVEMSVNCDTKVVKYVKHMTTPKSIFPKGMVERKQRQHTNLHCNKVGLATNGWTALDQVFDVNLDLVMELITRPSDCTE